MKKKLAAFVLSSSMVLSLAVPAFAAATNSDPTKEPGKYLQEIGVIKGDQNGDLLEGSNWKRQDVTVLLSTLLKQKEEAKATANTHGFTDVRGTNYNGFISWAKEKGYMVGESATKFGFDSEISYHDFAAIVLRALDYKVAYADVPTAAVEAKILPQGTDFTAKATRGNSYAVIVAALNTVIPGTGQTLGNKLGLPGFEVTDPAVTSVEALNLKQVKVTFNKEVDKASAETLGNYKTYNNGASTDLAAGGSVALQSDKKSVIVTLGTALNNGQNAKVVVENVKDSAKAIAKYENAQVVVSDTTVPSIVGVSVVGPRQLQVEFSEPVTGAVSGDFVIDNGNYLVSTEPTTDINKVTVTVGVDLTAGEHNLKVNSTASGVRDYAGYKPVQTTKTFTFVKDETAPVATVKSVSPTEVKVTFSKPVQNLTNGNVSYRHTYDSSTYEVRGNDVVSTTDNTPRVTVNSANTEITINFVGKPIPLGANNLYISYVSGSGTQITDLWGNKLAPVAIPVSVTLDNVKPVVKEVKFESAQLLKVIFSETVEQASAQTTSNYVVKDSTGKVVAITTALRGTGDKTHEVSLAFADDALGGGSYTVEVKGVKDIALVNNIMDAYSTTLTVNDTVKPYVLQSNYYGETDKVTIYVPFSEQMNTTTLVKANFLKKIGTEAYKALDGDDTVTPAADGKSVTIVLKGTSLDLKGIRVGAVTDVAGNGLTLLGAESEATTTTGQEAHSKTDGKFTLITDNVKIASVEATGSRQIKVTFDGRLSTVAAAGFALTADGAAYDNKLAIASHTINDSGKSVVLFNTEKDLSKDVKVGTKVIGLNYSTTGNASPTKTYLGNGLTVTTAQVDLKDKLAPGVKKVTVDAVGQITIEFDEALNPDTFTNTAISTNGFTVTGGESKLTKATISTTDATKVILTGDKFIAGTTSVNYNEAAGITDASNENNKLASFTDKKAE